MPTGALQGRIAVVAGATRGAGSEIAYMLGAVGARVAPHFIASETPYFVGRAVAALAADPALMVKSSGAYSSWGLADEYGFTDIDGRCPHWGRYFAEHVQGQSH